MLMRVLVLSVFIISFSFSNVHAREDSDNKATIAAMSTALEDISGDLGKVNQNHFFHIYGAHNMIGIANILQDRVSATVDACVKGNPDMSIAITKRYADWDSAVLPLLKEARGNMDNMILAQDYATKDDVESLFKLVDAVRALKPVEQVVSTKEACEFTLKSMDKSQAQISAMLRSTLASVPQR